MAKKLLVADDDRTFHDMVSRIFRGAGWDVRAAGDGAEAYDLAAAEPPDVILLDLHMPGLGGAELLGRLRRDARFAMTPIIVVTGDADPRQKAAGFLTGADDYIAKPFDTLDLVSRVEGAARRSRRMLAANPLTFLPGGPTIEEEAAARITSGAELAFFYIDIDNFKAFNDNYGYLNGDNAIKRTGELLTDVQRAFPEGDVFVGHIGGDDFVLMARHTFADRIAAEIIARFDALAPKFYNAADRARGRLVSADRMGKLRDFPLMTLTIAAASNERRVLDHYAKIVDIASEIKKYLKGLKERAGSVYLKDRRGDQPPPR